MVRAVYESEGTSDAEQLMGDGIPSTPYTLHPTHYTLHTTHYTLHTTHYTLVCSVRERGHLRRGAAHGRRHPEYTLSPYLPASLSPSLSLAIALSLTHTFSHSL